MPGLMALAWPSWSYYLSPSICRSRWPPRRLSWGLGLTIIGLMHQTTAASVCARGVTHADTCPAHQLRRRMIRVIVRNRQPYREWYFQALDGYRPAWVGNTEILAPRLESILLTVATRGQPCTPVSVIGLNERSARIEDKHGQYRRNRAHQSPRLGHSRRRRGPAKPRSSRTTSGAGMASR